MTTSRRLLLHQKLVEILGNSNRVYFQPPATLKMSYPCIRYSKLNIDTDNAGNKVYKAFQEYRVIYISKDPDDSIATQMFENFSRINSGNTYIADNLNHEVFDIYY